MHGKEHLLNINELVIFIRIRVHAEENKRRTLQRSDIATAISKTDMCDFLIDIVPREEAVKSQTTSYEQQPAEYSGYYAQGGVPQYAPQQVCLIF